MNSTDKMNIENVGNCRSLDTFHGRLKEQKCNARLQAKETLFCDTCWLESGSTIQARKLGCSYSYAGSLRDYAMSRLWDLDRRLHAALDLEIHGE